DLFDSPPAWGGPLHVYYSGCTESPYPDVCCVPPSETCTVPDLSLAGAQRPLIYANFGQGEEWPGASRVAIDTLDHPVNDCALWSNGQSQGDGFEVPVSNSSSGGAVTVHLSEEPPSAADGPCVCIATPALLNTIVSTTVPGLP